MFNVRSAKVEELRMAASAQLRVAFGQSFGSPSGAAAMGVPTLVADDPEEDGGGLSAHSDLTTLE